MSAAWGIGFTIWKSGISNDKEKFEVDVCDVNKDSYTGDIESKCKKCLYNIDNEISMKVWGMEPVKNFKNTDSVNLTSGLKIA